MKWSGAWSSSSGPVPTYGYAFRVKLLPFKAPIPDGGAWYSAWYKRAPNDIDALKYAQKQCDQFNQGTIGGAWTPKAATRRVSSEFGEWVIVYEPAEEINELGLIHP